MAQNRLFRDSAFGNFREMTQAMSIQPAMLFYLDNLDNVKSSPNQNFARELLELFTLGVVDQNGVPNYTEDDATAAPDAGASAPQSTAAFPLFRHGGVAGVLVVSVGHAEAKSFMGQSRNWDGPDIVNYVLQENTAKKLVACKFLSKKLWEHFAYQNPSKALVDELAQVLYNNDFAIKPWVKAMLMRDEFYSTTAMQGLVRSPVEYIVNLFHFTGYRAATLNPQWYVEGMGQVPFAPPDVSGWKTNGYWVNTSVFGSRAEFASDVASRMRQDDGNAVGKGRTPEQAVDFVAAMFGVSLSTASRNALLGFVNVQRQEESYVGWWESTNLLTMMMMTPEFHVA